MFIKKKSRSSLLDYDIYGLLRFVGPMVCRTDGVSDQWCVGLKVCRTNGVSDQWCVGPMVCRTNSQSPGRMLVYRWFNVVDGGPTLTNIDSWSCAFLTPKITEKRNSIEFRQSFFIMLYNKEIPHSHTQVNMFVLCACKLLVR